MSIPRLRIPKMHRMKVGILWKIFLAALAVIAVIDIYFACYALPKMRSNLFHEKEVETQQEVQIAWGMMNFCYNLESNHLVTRAEAQYYALQAISGLRYGPNDEGYFWINDYQPVLLEDPFSSDLVNTNVSNYPGCRGQVHLSGHRQHMQGKGRGII